VSLPITHALVPIAAAIAFCKRAGSKRLLAAAIVAAMIPDLDVMMHPLFNVPLNSAYGHRGALHSLSFAILLGVITTGFHRILKANRLAAAVVVAAATASHGLLDMLTTNGRGVAYLWPISSMRIYADWRPLPGSLESNGLRLTAIINRLGPEWHKVIAPMLVVAIVIRLGRRFARTKFGVECPV
jgi:inner membrane protein